MLSVLRGEPHRVWNLLLWEESGAWLYSYVTSHRAFVATVLGPSKEGQAGGRLHSRVTDEARPPEGSGALLRQL